MSSLPKARAPQNRTLVVNAGERRAFASGLLRLKDLRPSVALSDALIYGDMTEVLPRLPAAIADLVILDPPYNLSKRFGTRQFTRRSEEEYEAWIASWLPLIRRAIKPNGSLYACGDWTTCGAWQRQLQRLFTVRNRITWEREKGRGAKGNWKNASEDIWFCTASPKAYTFHADAVKLRRRVLAPYRQDGAPKDWQRSAEGDFRLTHPSNLWSDITVPFWSMPENTDHPTQKPEKLIAKLVLASSSPGDCVLDPFLGSGTTAVVARKLGRRFIGIDQEEEYLCWARKRLELAKVHPSVQGYEDGVFWERNSQKKPIDSRPNL